MFLFLLVLPGIFGADSPIRDSLYSDYFPSPCVSVLNNQGFVGCAPPDTVTAAIWEVGSNEDLQTFLSTPPGQPMSVLLPLELFNSVNLAKMYRTNMLAGVLVKSAKAPAVDSPASKESVGGCTAGETHEWNSNGSGMNFESFKFPIVMLTQKDTEIFSEFASKNLHWGSYSGRSLQWVAEMRYRMFASSNSIACLSETSKCDPMGGYNVWSVFGAALAEKKPIVLVGVQTDSNSFFHNLAVGARSDNTAVAALLSSVSLLNTFPEISNGSKTLIVVAFQAEVWGNVGSNSFFNDILNFKCLSGVKDNRCTSPYNLSPQIADIDVNLVETFIQIDQLDSNIDEVFIHAGCSPSPLATKIAGDLTTLLVSGESSPIKRAPKNIPFPPSAARVFSERIRDTPSLSSPSPPSVLLLSSYSDKYTNKYYHSQFDEFDEKIVPELCRKTNAISSVLYKLLTDKLKTFNQDCSLVGDIFGVLSNNHNSSLTPRVSGQPETLTQYSSIYRPNVVTLQTSFFYNFLATAHAKVFANCSAKEDCRNFNDTTCVWGKCVEDRTYYHDALPLGLQVIFNTEKNYVEKISVVNSSMPIWAESVWNSDIGIKVYLQENLSTEIATFAFGLVVFASSFGAVFFGGRIYDKNFKLN